MSNYSGLAVLLLLVSLASGPAKAVDTASELSLADVLSATVQHQGNASPDEADIPYQSSSWLTALPSLGLSYLASDEDQGTDETELRLNLPFKSPSARKLEAELRSLVTGIDRAESERRELYLSGLIRESLWSERIAATRASFSDKKITLLEGLLETREELFAAHSASRYSLLLIRQELTDAEIRKQDHLWEAASWKERYRSLTGIRSLPGNIFEPGPGAVADYAQHPALRLLDLSWERQQKLIAAGSASNTPWNLALTAKQLDNPQLDENQYGLAVDIPLSIFDVANESSRSEWREASRAYWQSRDELLLALTQRGNALAGKADFLAGKQALLDESTRISEQLMNETRELMGQNELGREIWVRRILKGLDKQADAAINTLFMGQNQAMTRQAAGIPL